MLATGILTLFSLKQKVAEYKYDTSELIYETETGSQTQITDLSLSRGGGTGKGWIGNLGRADANSYIEWVKNEVLLYSPGNYIQYPVINL